MNFLGGEIAEDAGLDAEFEAAAVVAAAATYDAERS